MVRPARPRTLNLQRGASPLFGLALAMVLSLLCSPLAAQDQAPLRLAVVNVSKRGGAGAKQEIVGLLAKNENIDLIDPQALLDTMEDYGVNYKILRRGSLRAKFRSRIGDLMQGTNIEGLFLIDSFGRGSKVQLIAMGPAGSEVANLRRNATRGRLDRDDAIDLLREVFPSLAPEVLAHRERLARLTQEAAAADPPPPPQPAPSPAAQTPAPEPATVVSAQEALPRGPGARALAPSLSPSVGLMVGSRTLETTEVEGLDSLNHTTPLIGLGVELQGILIALGRAGGSALGVDLAFGYATFSTAFQDKQTMEKTTFPSSFTRTSGQLVYHRLLSDLLKLEVFGGAGLTDVVIEKNASYTGNRYITGRLGAGLTYFFGQESFFTLYGGLLPLFEADTSGGALGPSPLGLGYTAGASLGFYVTPLVFTKLHYAFEFLLPEYPEPTGQADIDDPAQATDLFHIANITVGVSF